MNRIDWLSVEALFAAAIERPLDQQIAFVHGSSSDPVVVKQVVSLLHAHGRRGRLDTLADRLGKLGPAAARNLASRLAAALTGLYNIEREIGRGGMAIVYLAEDLKHHRKVAVKVLHPALTRSVGVPRFLHEIAIAAQLAHPHILPLYDSGESDGLLFYTMPYVDGESLRDRLRLQQRLPLRDALTVAREVSDALSCAHARNIVHCDIKPENILFLAGHAVVSDFGIASAMNAAGVTELIETDVILGTPAYMSPEQATGTHEVDGRTDIYALGCVLFEALTGRPPFAATSAEAILALKANADAPSLREIAPHLPQPLDDTLRHALARAPADRFSDGQQFAAALSARLAETQVRQGSPSREASGSADAYRFYLKGNFHLEQASEGAFRKAVEEYQQAITIDPTYAPAHAAMATAYIELGSWLSSFPPQEFRDLAMAAALQSIEHDRNLAEAHIALARIKHLFDWDWSAAEREFNTALSLNPSEPVSLVIYANYLSAMGRFEEQEATCRRAIACDPLYAPAHEHLGWALEYLGRPNEALRSYRKANELAPDYIHIAFAELCVKLGWLDEASRLADHFETLLLDDGPPVYLEMLAHLFGKIGRTTDAQRIITVVERRGQERYVPPCPLGCAYLSIGQKERAYELLERAYQIRDLTLVWLKVRWTFDPIRHEPRFQQLLSRMAFPR